MAHKNRTYNGVNIFVIFLFGVMALVFLFQVPDAEALSQFARKYKVECSTCHTSFPRLTFFGEKFMRNGFQWPGGKPDGDTTGKEQLSDTLFIDQVGNWLGARLSLSPLKYKTNKLVRNGKLEDSFDVGNTNWLQFFVAGSIFKDVAVFIEQEFETDGSKTNWYHLFFTNIAGSTTANLQVGRLSPAEFTSFSDRLRIWQKSDVLNVKSSKGKGENSVNIRSPRPGIQYYGYKGAFSWFAGVDNGKDVSDTDRDKNFWGGVRVEVPDTVKSKFVGSSASFHIYEGTDTAATAVSQIDNDFTRYTAATTVRYGDEWDFMFVYQYGEDDNWDLTPVAVERDFDGFTVTGAWWREPFYVVLQYDEVNSDDIPSIEVNKISPSVWYFLRNNFKIGLTSRIDVSGANEKKHEVGIDIRTMF